MNICYDAVVGTKNILHACHARPREALMTQLSSKKRSDSTYGILLSLLFCLCFYLISVELSHMGALGVSPHTPLRDLDFPRHIRSTCECYAVLDLRGAMAIPSSPLVLSHVMYHTNIFFSSSDSKQGLKVYTDRSLRQHGRGDYCPT